MLRCLHWVGGKFYAQRSIRSDFVQLWWEEESKTSLNINYLNILLLLGVVLCLYTPTLIYYFTEFNIYDYSSNLYSVYPSSVINIRICCATVFLNLIILLACFNYNRLKLSRFNKSIMSAATIIVKGGFEGLGDLNLEEHMRTRDSSSKFTDLELELSLPPAQKESPSKDSSGTFPKLNTAEGQGVPILGPSGYSTAKSIREWDTFSYTQKGPDISPLSAISSLTGSIYEPASMSEDNTKKVRFKDQTEVFIINNLDEVNTMDKQASKQAKQEFEDQNRIKNNIEMKNEVSYNLKPTLTEIFKGKRKK